MPDALLIDYQGGVASATATLDVVRSASRQLSLRAVAVVDDHLVPAGTATPEDITFVGRSITNEQIIVRLARLVSREPSPLERSADDVDGADQPDKARVTPGLCKVSMSPMRE